MRRGSLVQRLGTKTTAILVRKKACLRVHWHARRCNRQAAPEYPLLL